MCGGGGQRAKITQPDYKAYDQMASAQFAAMAKAQDPKVLKAQNKLNNALSAESDVNAQLRDVKTQQAEYISAEAARVAALLGAPPQAKAASAPAVGQNRISVTRGGRGAGALRTGPSQQSLQLGAS